MEEKRKTSRKKVIITTVVRKLRPEGGCSIYEFKSKDLSLGGIFISAEDLSLFDLGEEIEILVDDDGKRYYEGRAIVVRSARVFTEEGSQVDSGYGLMFLTPGPELKEMLKEKLQKTG